MIIPETQRRLLENSTAVLRANTAVLARKFRTANVASYEEYLHVLTRIEYETLAADIFTALISGQFVAFEGAEMPEMPDPPRDGSLDAVEPLDWHKVAASCCCACGDPVLAAVVVTPAHRPTARYDLPVCAACADRHVEHGALDRRMAGGHAAA